MTKKRYIDSDKRAQPLALLNWFSIAKRGSLM